ncbi:hypothetical protein QAD02_020917 [Eretmocerus hayati]|uniref:Uncharacterized protein n=1 Tax=Eretmocerus hayati TaxID=131215 RepID=A0ACC2PP91_9HYME|nr:hypothetical protein QAD02_020917 [Eretmocerus hayati]
MMELQNSDSPISLSHKPKSKYYKWCFAPQCKNTSVRDPDLVFFLMPGDRDGRKKWFSAARRASEPTKSNYFCCQKHSDLESDMENFVGFRLFGGNLALKKGVVPNKFECQPDCTLQSLDLNKTAYKKVNEQKDLQEILQNDAGSPSAQAASTGLSIATGHHHQSAMDDQEDIENNDQNDHESPTNVESVDLTISNTGNAWDLRIRAFREGSLRLGIKSIDHSSNKRSLVRSDGSKSYVPSTNCTSSPEKCPSQNEKDMKFAASNFTRYLISGNPKKYFGIPEECMPWVMNLLKKHSKQNIPRSCTYFIAFDLMKTLIRQPSTLEVKKNLPIPFGSYYSNVYTLIDAFEIQIKEPTNPVHQSLTWSEYKKCNTWKWIILCTPDGKFIFVSKAYGGRVSDMLLLEDSGDMDILPESCTVMADRGFKSLESLPSVYEAVQPTKEEVLETRRVAAFRIHVERLVRS